MHHSGAFRAAGMRGRICCLKIESVHVVPGKRQRDPGPITTAVPIVQGWCISATHNDHVWLWVPAFAGTTTGFKRG